MNTGVLVPSARQLVTEINVAYPGRGTESDGSIASPEHSAANPSSDHEPGPDGSPSPGKVDAVDLDADLIPGDPAASRQAMYGDVLPRFQAHAGTQYWIHDDMICHRSEGWIPRTYAYAGPNRNRHILHVHLNWQETVQAHSNATPYGFEGADTMEPADILGYDPGLNADGTPKRGGIPNPRPAERTANPTIAPSTALYRAAAGYDVGLETRAMLKTLLARPTTVTLSQADREVITRDVTAAVLAALPEYGPRPNTP